MGAKHASAWQARADARVVAVCDLQAERVQEMCQQTGAAGFERWQDAIAHADVDVVSVCVPASFHRDVAVAAADAGRHVLCEKAMALTLADADEMIARAEAAGVQLSVCHQYRDLSRYRTMKRLIDEGRLGGPLHMRFTELREVRPKLAMHRRDMNGGPVHDMTGHLFDLGRYLTGCEAISVTATGSVFARGKTRTAPVTDFGIDTADILVRFDGGHCLSIGINWGLPEGTPGYCHDLVHGPLGALYSVDPGKPDRFLGDPSESLSIALKDASGTTLFACEPDHAGPEAVIEDLIAQIEGRGASRFSGHDGRAALRLILAALESIDTGQTVEV